MKILQIKFLDWFGYFDQLEHSSISEEPLGSEEILTEETISNNEEFEAESTSYLSNFFSSLIWLLTLPFITLKAFFGSAFETFKLPPKDLQLKRTKDGKCFQIGSRSSLRLKGLTPDQMSLPSTSRRRRSTNVRENNLTGNGIELETEISGRVRLFYIGLLNKFGYFDQLEPELEPRINSEKEGELSQDQSSKFFRNSFLTFVKGIL